MTELIVDSSVAVKSECDLTGKPALMAFAR